MLINTVLLFLLGSLASVQGLAIQTRDHPAGGYRAYCRSSGLQHYRGIKGAWLGASCSDTPTAGAWPCHDVAIDLNKCIENSNGVLGWHKDGRFSDSCLCETWWTDWYTTLHCKCVDFGTLQGINTTLYLDEGIYYNTTARTIGCGDYLGVVGSPLHPE
ncbi:hypothetical protein QBC35DRAFT_552691, partial [Podospora australis]